MTALHVDVAYALEAVGCVVGVRVVEADEDGGPGPVELLVALRPYGERQKYDVARTLWPIVGRPGMAAVAFWDAGAQTLAEPRYVKRAYPIVLTPAQRREAAARARERERAREARISTLVLSDADPALQGSARVGSRRIVLDEASGRSAVVLVAATPEDARGLLSGADLVVCDARSWPSLCRLTREGIVLPAILRAVATPDVAPSVVAEMVAQGAVVVRAASLTAALDTLVADVAAGRTTLDVVWSPAARLASGDAAWYRR